MADRGEPDEEDEADEDDVDRPTRVERKPEHADQAQEEERSGEDPPGSPDPTIGRALGPGRRVGGFAHVRVRGWRSGRVPSIPAAGTDGPPSGGTFVLRSAVDR